MNEQIPPASPGPPPPQPPMQPQPNKGMEKKKLAIIIGVVVLIVIIGAIASAVSGGDSDKNTGKTTTVEETDTTKSVTEETSTSGLTAEETAYANEMVDLSGKLADSLDALGMALGDFDYSEESIMALAAAIVDLRLIIDEARAMSAPPKFAEPHSMFLQACDKYDQVTDLLTEGIDEYDVEKLEAATDLMNEATEIINDATDKLDDI